MGEPDLELITVMAGNDRLVLALARGLLEDAGIPFYAAGDDIRSGRRTPGTDWEIQVACDREKEAQALLKLLATSNAMEQTPGAVF